MLDSVFIGTSGLIGFSKALRVVSNNLANVNTPGFKGSQLDFADFYHQNPGTHSQTGSSLASNTQLGTGLNTLGTTISLRDGTAQNTGNDLDALISGNGFFILKDEAGKQLYTRLGSFQVNNGNLVSRSNGYRVQGFDANGRVADISLTSLLDNPPQASTRIEYDGNLDINSGADITNSATQLFDSLGRARTLTLVLSRITGGGNPAYTVTVTDGSTMVGTGNLTFNSSGTLTSSPLINLTYTPPGSNALTFALDFTGVTAFAPPPNTPAFTFERQDGHAAGQLSRLTIDQSGVIKASYTNGQNVDGPTLALARARLDQDLRQLGGGLFETVTPDQTEVGRANTGAFGRLTAQSLEGSNVDLAQEFSNLIVMQRGYQASSRVISTANELIQELFDTKGRN